MITLSVVKARMKRKRVKEIAGESFIAPERIVALIPFLEEFRNEQFLFGIYNSPKVWTVLSVRRLFGCYNGPPFSLIINKRAREVHNYVERAETKHVVDVVLNDGNRVWMKSVGMSCLFQNMLLMLQDLPDNVVLEE